MPPFATCPTLFGGETDLPGRPQRNGEVDAGDRSLALKMQAWCLQREGVLPPTVQLATGGGVGGRGWFLWDFFFCFGHLGPKRIYPKKWRDCQEELNCTEHFTLVLNLMSFP